MTSSPKTHRKIHYEDLTMIRSKRRRLFIIGGIVLSTVYLIQYSNYEFKDSSASNQLANTRNSQYKSKGKIYPRGVVVKVNKASGDSGRMCTVAVAIILCQDSPATQNAKNIQGNYHTATDFSRQINQTVVMLKSIALLTKFSANATEQDSEECVNIIVISDTKGHYKTILNRIDKDEKWSDDFRKRIKFSYIPVKYPTGSQWMRKLFRPCATLRLFLAELLPTYDSLIYLDTDIIFFQSVQNLWSEFHLFKTAEKETNLPIAAMAPCLFHYGTKQNEIPYYGSSGLNAGIMLMNLTRMRSTLWTHKIRMVTTMFQNKIKLADQEECGKLRARVLAHYRIKENRVELKPEELEEQMIVIGQTAETRFDRAQIIQLERENRVVTIKNVDNGEVHKVYHNKIFWIEPKFMEAPFQMTPVELHGLEFFRGSSVLKYVMSDMSKKLFHKKVYVTSFDAKNRIVPTVTIYVDARKKECLNNIVEEYVTSYYPRLPAPEGAMISNIEADGKIWIQKDTPLFRLMYSYNQPDQQLVADRAERELNGDGWGSNIQMQLSQSRQGVFYGRYEDGNYYRIFIHNRNPRMPEFDVEYMEFGNSKTISLGDIKVCEDFGPYAGILKDIPRQCIVAQMSGIGYVDIAKVWDYIDVDKTILRVEIAADKRDITHHNYELPLVDIFICSEDEGGTNKINLNQLLLKDGVAGQEYLLGNLGKGGPISQASDLMGMMHI